MNYGREVKPAGFAKCGYSSGGSGLTQCQGRPQTIRENTQPNMRQVNGDIQKAERNPIGQLTDTKAHSLNQKQLDALKKLVEFPNLIRDIRKDNWLINQENKHKLYSILSGLSVLSNIEGLKELEGLSNFSNL